MGVWWCKWEIGGTRGGNEKGRISDDDGGGSCGDGGGEWSGRTPGVHVSGRCFRGMNWGGIVGGAQTESLDIILIETSFHILHHQARLPNLRIPHHPHLDDDAVPFLCLARRSVLGS